MVDLEKKSGRRPLHRNSSTFADIRGLAICKIFGVAIKRQFCFRIHNVSDRVRYATADKTLEAIPHSKVLFFRIITVFRLPRQQKSRGVSQPNLSAKSHGSLRSVLAPPLPCFTPGGRKPTNKRNRANATSTHYARLSDRFPFRLFPPGNVDPQSLPGMAAQSSRG